MAGRWMNSSDPTPYSNRPQQHSTRGDILQEAVVEDSRPGAAQTDTDRSTVSSPEGCGGTRRLRRGRSGGAVLGARRRVVSGRLRRPFPT